MFDGAQDQFHQFIAPRTTLPLHLSFPLHVSPTPTNTFIPFDPYNPSSHHHHLPLQTTLLHPPTSSPTHKHHEQQHNKQLPSTINLEIQTDHQTQLPELTDSWTNDEVLALLRIRSSMENWFPELTWDHVSRKLAELGFKKSAEKCKEKFEDESRCFDNINNNYGKNNFRFLSELEELCQNPDSGGGSGDGVLSDHEKTHHLGGDNNMVHQALEENSRDINGTKQLCDDHGSDNKVVEKSKEKKRKRHDRFEMFKGFCESVVNKMMAQQEEIHNKLLEDMVKRDQEKFAREEAWKKQEMDRMNKELDIMTQEQAIAGDRHATIIEFLKKCATTTTTTTSLLSPPSHNAKHYKTNGSNPSPLHLQNPNNVSDEDNTNLDPIPMILNHDQTTLGGENPSTSDTLLQQVPSSSNSSPAPHNPSSSLNSHSNNIIPLESNSISTCKATSTTPMVTRENSKEDVGRRWPRDEVLALINLRCTSLSNNNEEKEGNKGPLWERISQGMSEVGYKRSAKRCKEKWENINKYFRKTKDVNKKRSLNSRTCPYFHQLSCLYDEGKIVAQSERDQGNPTTNSDHVQVDESSQVGSGELVQYACVEHAGEKIN